jgi:hypothetical protein
MHLIVDRSEPGDGIGLGEACGAVVPGITIRCAGVNRDTATIGPLRNSGSVARKMLGH